jgi:hypothetical protein
MITNLPIGLAKGCKSSELANNIGKFRGGTLAENGSIGKIYLNALPVWHNVNPPAAAISH